MSDKSRVFISHAGVDRAWAEWARWHLGRAGYPTELDRVDWKAGDNFVERMHAALERSNPMLVLLSRAYLSASRFTTDEWTARFAKRRSDPSAKLIPLRIESVDLTAGIWAPIIVPDLFDLGPQEAARRLLTTVREVLEPPKPPPASEPRYPDGPPPATVDAGPRPPGFPPPVWNVDHRNPAFTGRDDVLDQVHDGLAGDGRVSVQALHGMGGVGKTQLVLEYAHRFAGEYDLVWWVFAEQTGSIGEQFAALGVELGIVDREADSAVAKSKVLSHLAGRRRWLLIFDNVVTSEDVLPWLPRGGGHVLITSRRGNWQRVAHAVELDVLPRAESVHFLVEQRPTMDPVEAGELAEALGDLPLALAQAAGYLSETGMPVGEYRELLVEETQAVLELGRPVDYPQSLAAAITLSLTTVAEVDPAAAAILRLCAFLAPEPIPADLIFDVAQSPSSGPRVLEPLREVLGKRLARQEAVGRIGAYGLARLGSGTLTVHRLTQAVVRGRLEPADADELAAHLASALGAMNPGDPKNPDHWAAWGRLLPHLLAVEPAGTDDPAWRECARDAVVYLISRGDPRPARQLAENLYEQWRQRLGADHRDTLRAATELVWALRDLGEYRQLRGLVDDTLTRQIATLGREHPDTLRSAADLAVVVGILGNNRRAEEIERDVWERRHRILGEEHPDTLLSAHNVAASLAQSGQPHQALALQQQVWYQRGRVLGEEHPDALTSAHNVAGSLADLGRYREALALHQQVWSQRRRVLGEEHPDALTSAGSVAGSLADLGRYQEALTLREQVWEQHRRILGEEHPSTLTSANYVATSLGELGRHREALTLKEQVWEQHRRILGEEHPSTLASAAGVAESLSELGRHHEALTLRERVWEHDRHILGDKHPSTLASAGNMAKSLGELGRLDEALTLKQQVWEDQRRTLGDEHPDTLTSANNVASSMGELGRLQEALALKQRVWEQRRRTLGETHPDTLTSANNVSVSLDGLGRHQEALVIQQQAWEQRRVVLGEEHPTTFMAGLGLAIVYFNLGRLLPARRLADQAWKGLRERLGPEDPRTRRAARTRELIVQAMGGRGRKRKP